MVIAACIKMKSIWTKKMRWVNNGIMLLIKSCENCLKRLLALTNYDWIIIVFKSIFIQQLESPNVNKDRTSYWICLYFSIFFLSQTNQIYEQQNREKTAEVNKFFLDYTLGKYWHCNNMVPIRDCIDQECYLVTKHSWKGKYKRILAISKTSISTYNPDKFDVTNKWPYSDVVAIAPNKSLQNVCIHCTARPCTDSCIFIVYSPNSF